MTPVAASILIVDDEVPNRLLLETMLRREGYDTRSAANGEEALASVDRAPPDLILLDLRMPGMDGCQVAKILKRKPATANIPIIMVTVLGDQGARLAGLESGVEEYLAKPIVHAELRLRVRNLLRLKAAGDFLEDRSAFMEKQVQARAAELHRFRTAMDATADAIILVNRTTMGIVEANTAACRMLGYAHDELLGIDPARIVSTASGSLESDYDAIIAGTCPDGPAEVELRCRDGTTLSVEAQTTAQRSGEDWLIVGVLRDVSARKESERRLHQLAHYDPLTGLPNRTLFNENLGKSLKAATAGGWSVAVLCLDLDNFKTVNDTLGHAKGDELLAQLGGRLAQCVRIRDTVGRLGGDEFALMLVLQEGKQGAAIVARKILEAMRAPFHLHGHDATVTASVGISVHPDDATDPETLMMHADTAMYRAKQEGRDTYRYFTAQMNQEVLARLDLEAALRKAFENGEFVLHYQPQVGLSSGRITGAEALIRWQRPGVGLVPPAAFIPVLEETGLIVPVGRWVIASACRQIGLWLRSDTGPVKVSVNISGRQFVDCELYDDVAKGLDDNDVPANLLELELTESTLMENTERTVACLQRVKARGARISIDDFGTGYSSLAYLRRFPIDRLKIDIAFIRDVTTNPDDAAIALAIIHMAHRLDLDTVAEGVETPAQVAYLRRHQCGHMQGFCFSPAVPADAFEAMVRAGKCLPDPAAESPRTLLIVDDEVRILNSLEVLLRQDGYQVLKAQSAAEGFDLLALHRVDVLLCDERMPGMSGTAFLDKVKDLYPETFRIVLSGQADPGRIMDAINCGAVQRFYAKPWDNRTLRDDIGEAFRQHAYRQYARAGGGSDAPLTYPLLAVGPAAGASEESPRRSATGAS